MPDLGEGLEDAEVVSVHVEEGEYVVADQPLLSVETDKAVVEIPSPMAGLVVRLAVHPGERIKVGQPVAEFGDGGHRESGSVVGDLPVDPADHPGTEAGAAGSPTRPTPAPTPGVKAAPAVRELARRLGVDLSGVTPTGPGGTIVSRDVEEAARVQTADSGAESDGKAEPLTGTRLAMARSLAEAHSQIAATTVTDEVDVEGWAAQGDITLRLIRAVASACAAEPALNAWYDERAQSRRLHRKVDLGMAVDTEEGLFVPVLRDVGGHGAGELRRELARLRGLVERRAIRPEDLRGATISLSNFGVFGTGLTGALMVVPPQVAILGCGRLIRRVVPAGDGFAVHAFLPLSLTFDHRVVTGGEASRFLGAAIADLEKTA
jgi:2-oxoisovalerate dehydrogenase E2 component (dihydrolipoyl transacylase)